MSVCISSAVCKASSHMPEAYMQTMSTLQEAALRVLTRRGDRPPYTPPGIARMVVHRQSKPYRLRFARVLGELRWRALIERVTGFGGPHFVGAPETRDMLNRFNDY